MGRKQQSNQAGSRQAAHLGIFQLLRACGTALVHSLSLALIRPVALLQTLLARRDALLRLPKLALRWREGGGGKQVKSGMLQLVYPLTFPESRTRAAECVSALKMAPQAPSLAILLATYTHLVPEPPVHLVRSGAEDPHGCSLAGLCSRCWVVSVPWGCRGTLRAWM